MLLSSPIFSIKYNVFSQRTKSARKTKTRIFCLKVKSLADTAANIYLVTAERQGTETLDFTTLAWGARKSTHVIS